MYCRRNVKVQRFAEASRFFCAVKNRDSLHCRRQSLEQMLCRERSVKSYLYNSVVSSAVAVHVLYGIVGYFGRRADRHNHISGCRRTRIVKQPVMPPGNGGNRVHCLLHDCRESVIKTVSRLCVLKIHILILCRAAQVGVFGVHGA